MSQIYKREIQFIKMPDMNHDGLLKKRQKNWMLGLHAHLNVMPQSVFHHTINQFQ